MKKKHWLTIILIALLLIPLIGWILPGDFFDNSEAILCPSRLFFDFECLGCGITRAVMHFHHFQFGEALYYNYLVLGVYPMMVFFWGKWTWGLFRKLQSKEKV